MSKINDSLKCYSLDVHTTSISRDQYFSNAALVFPLTGMFTMISLYSILIGSLNSYESDVSMSL